MKQLSFFALIATLLFAVPVARAAEGGAKENLASAKQQPQMLRGSVVDDEGNYISYVTVVAMRDGRQVAGASSNTQGVFSFSLADGTYTIVVECVGYEPFEQQITMPEGADMGVITLKAFLVYPFEYKHPTARVLTFLVEFSIVPCRIFTQTECCKLTPNCLCIEGDPFPGLCGNANMYSQRTMNSGTFQSTIYSTAVKGRGLGVRHPGSNFGFHLHAG